MAKDYGFSVEFFGTYGTFSVEANDIDEAYNNATEEIRNALKDLPVQVEFEVECYENPDDDDAYEIAKETDGGEFMPYDDGAWEIDNVEELNEDPE